MREWKYDVRICKCGRIHMIPVEKIDKAVTNDKALLYICGGCGAARIIGADRSVDFDTGKPIYNMYTVDMTHKDDEIVSINTDDFNSDNKHHCRYSEILYSPGLKVPMMTGEYARSHFGDTFCDMWYPDWYRIERRDVTVAEIMEFINKYKEDQKTVNMDRFIRETPEEYLDAISGYYIKAFDWTGTKWDRKYN